MAGALNVQLAGPRIYGGVLVKEAMMNGAGRSDANAGDITRGIAVFYLACSAIFIATFLYFFAAILYSQVCLS